MKLLLVSDLHYRLRQFDWLTTAADDVDVVVIAGDLLDIRSDVPLEAQIIAVSAQLRDLGLHKPVLTASGNHDLVGRNEAGEKAAGWLNSTNVSGVHVDGDAVLIDDTLFSVCPWWDGPIARAELEQKLTADADLPKKRWVWVYHAPPTGSPLSWDGRREYGDEALAEWIPRFQPDLVLTGHIHTAPFVEGGDWAQRLGTTWLFNAGQEHGPVPTHIVIDLDQGTADWTSATEHRQMILDAATQIGHD
jgi:Icc-related predicted phosphoesterase